MYKTLHKKQGSVTVQLRFARSSVTFCAKRDSKWIDNRRQMRRREMLHLEDPDAEEEIMNLLLEGEIGIQLLDQEVIDRDIYWNVWKIVKSMKKDWRDVLILRVLEGLTAEEACAVLKIKSTVCCTRLYRAKAELQKRVLRAKLFDI